MANIDYSSLHVLILDDDDFIRKATERLLRKIGIGTISSAGNGKEGLKLMREAAPPVDLIMCDFVMPEMNGLDFVSAVRGSDTLNRDVAILMITGENDQNIVRSATRLSVNGYLVKPIERVVLESQIAAALARRDPKSLTERVPL